MSTKMHISRSFGPDRFAPECGCTLLPCGTVDADEAVHKSCDQHDPRSARTIRQIHDGRKCDEEFARTAIPDEPDYVYSHDVLGEDDRGTILAPRAGTDDYWEPFDRFNPAHIAAMNRTRETGQISFLELETEGG